MSDFREPLASILRPKNLDEFIGQDHLVGEGKPLSAMIALGAPFSLIFWGPPGVGKTTLAKIIARETGRSFIELSAVSASKADIKKVLDRTQEQKTLMESYQAPVLFLDEIHRFNKAQQDFLLPSVESGQIVLIGATTENPSFEVIPPLLSRMRVFVLNPLKDEELSLIIKKALKLLKIKKIAKASEEFLLNYADGDARKLLTIIDNAYALYGNLKLSSLKNALQSKQILYDKKGEEHYNIISAFIKSLRASDVDAALYYLARMVKAGEDPKFIARRMVIFASEDVGMAQPTALVVANEVFEAVMKIGYPEAQISLAHGVTYLALAKKDRSAYDAYFSALADVEKFGNLAIPLKLRNAPTQLMKNLKYGEGYSKYKPGKNEKEESYLPEKIKGKKYYRGKISKLKAKNKK